MKLTLIDYKTAELIRVLDWNGHFAPPMIGDFIDISDLNGINESHLYVIKERCFKFDHYEFNCAESISFFVSEVKT